MTHQPTWRKSSLSTDGGNCVEIAQFDDGTTLVRDSKRPEGPVLSFTAAEWTAFLAGARAGEFDAA